MSGEELELVT